MQKKDMDRGVRGGTGQGPQGLARVRLRWGREGGLVLGLELAQHWQAAPRLRQRHPMRNRDAEQKTWTEDFGVARAKARRALPVFDCVEARRPGGPAEAMTDFCGLLRILAIIEEK